MSARVRRLTEELRAIHSPYWLTVGLLLLLSTTAVAVPTMPTLPDYELAYRVEGDLEGSYFGWSLARINDVTGDGRQDLVVGAPAWGGGGCQSYVYLLEQTLTGTTTLARIDAPANNRKLGYSVCGLSDISGDGVPDYAAGASFGEYVVLADGGNRTIGGKVASHPGVLQVLPEAAKTHYYGTSLAALSNGQLIESSRPSTGGVGTSAVWYVPGDTMQEKLKIQANHQYRSDPSIRNVGDVVGNDGLDDFLVATDDGGSQGRISMVSGAVAATGTVTLASIESYHFDGPAADTILGDLVSWGQCPMSTAGDFNGDGIMDFVFTADRPNNGAGAVYFYDGATREMSWELPRPTGVMHWNAMVENVGDIDGDGRDDVAVSALMTGNLNVLFFYNPATQEFLGSLSGETSNDQFGRSMITLGDVNGDGRADFCVGVPGADTMSPDAGAVHVYLSVPEPSAAALLTLGMLVTLGVLGLRRVRGF